MADPVPILELYDIVVAYGALRAIDGVSLSVRAGQVLGACGDNGAGRSSLMKVIAGAHVPTGGELRIDGTSVRMAGPRDALSRGIAAIYQDLALAPRLSIAENVFMGAEPIRGGWEARLIVMDEPTAALGVRETGRVLALIRSLARSGVAVVLVCHNMDHVLAVASDVLVLKQGRRVAARAAAGLNAQALSQMILTGQEAA